MKEDNININSDNINEYYEKVNDIIDDYFTYSIKPSALKRYLKPGSLGEKKFIKRNNLSNITNISKIIKDIVDDRYSMEKDDVLTFESFGEISKNINFNSSNVGTGIDDILYKNLTPTDNTMEKIIADYYRIGLGHIETVDVNKHHMINQMLLFYLIPIFRVFMKTLFNIYMTL